MNRVNLIRNDVAPKNHAEMSINQYNSSFKMKTSPGETRATSHKRQTPDALRALEDKIHRDIR